MVEGKGEASERARTLDRRNTQETNSGEQTRWTSGTRADGTGQKTRREQTETQRRCHTPHPERAAERSAPRSSHPLLCRPMRCLCRASRKQPSSGGQTQRETSSAREREGASTRVHHDGARRRASATHPLPLCSFASSPAHLCPNERPQPSTARGETLRSPLNIGEHRSSTLGYACVCAASFLSAALSPLVRVGCCSLFLGCSSRRWLLCARAPCPLASACHCSAAPHRQQTTENMANAAAPAPVREGQRTHVPLR
jgi:hypothetical protein